MTHVLESIENIGTIIIGGMDRGIDYQILCDYFEKNTKVNVICMYASGEKIYDMLSGRENLYMCNNLVEATNKAKEITKSGQACVLSPAAASYDHFKNFEERGDLYKHTLGL